MDSVQNVTATSPLVEYNRPLMTTVELMSATERQDHRQTGHWFALDLELNWKLLQSHRHCPSLSKRRVQHARRPPDAACIPLACCRTSCFTRQPGTRSLATLALHSDCLFFNEAGGEGDCRGQQQFSCFPGTGWC